MALYRKKPVVITAITFDELVEHGRLNARAKILATDMPWSFDYGGHSITHENDDCYLIPTLEGTMRFERGDMLITGVKGEIYPCKGDIFAATYDVAGPSALADVAAERQRQVDVEGWSFDHDDRHDIGELGLAAALYALPYEAEIAGEKLLSQDDFIALDITLTNACNWNLKPEPDRRRRMVKAGALILAEIERLDRAGGPQ